MEPIQTEPFIIGKNWFPDAVKLPIELSDVPEPGHPWKELKPMTRRDLILAKAGGIPTVFMYYDRKEDEELPVGAIEAAVAAGEITYDEIAAEFRAGLE